MNKNKLEEEDKNIYSKIGLSYDWKGIIFNKYTAVEESIMPSYDIVSKLDMGEVKNIVNMAKKQITGRYDFKGSNTSIELKGEVIELKGEDDYKLTTALGIFRDNMVKRNIGMKSVEVGDVAPSGNQMLKQVLTLKSGVDKDQAKVINRLIKECGFKVTSSYLDEKVRVTGKKIDDLRSAFSFVKNHNDIKLDLQMENIKS